VLTVVAIQFPVRLRRGDAAKDRPALREYPDVGSRYNSKRLHHSN
jgi:hypothetical protein